MLAAKTTQQIAELEDLSFENDPKKIKCYTCADDSTGTHFGGITCESCKSFFRRSVKENRWKDYKCLDSSQCNINKITRKFCRYCRYNKCLKIGMRPQWVLTDEEREKKYCKKNRSVLNVNVNENETIESMNELLINYGIFGIDLNSKNKNLTKFEKCLINKIVNTFYCTRKSNDLHVLELSLQLLKLNINSIPHNDGKVDPLLSKPSFELIMSGPFQRLTAFVKAISEFQKLTSNDQISLLRGSAIELFIVKTFIMLDLNTNKFQSLVSREHDHLNLKPLKDIDAYSLENDNKILCSIWSAEVIETTTSYLRSLSNLIIDETTLIIFLLVILFTPDRADLINRKLVLEIQSKYSYLLFKYLIYKLKTEEKAFNIFSKLLIKMIELRDIQEVHRAMKLGYLDIRESVHQVEAITGGLIEPLKYTNLVNVFPNEILHVNTSPECQNDL
jgi:hypothetical protein